MTDGLVFQISNLQLCLHITVYRQREKKQNQIGVQSIQTEVTWLQSKNLKSFLNQNLIIIKKELWHAETCIYFLHYIFLGVFHSIHNFFFYLFST